MTVLITTLAAIVLLLLKAWVSSKPARTQEDRDEEIQQGRADIVDGNADNVELRIDQATAASNPARLGDDQDTARRLEDITKL